MTSVLRSLKLGYSRVLSGTAFKYKSSLSCSQSQIEAFAGSLHTQHNLELQRPQKQGKMREKPDPLGLPQRTMSRGPEAGPLQAIRHLQPSRVPWRQQAWGQPADFILHLSERQSLKSIFLWKDFHYVFFKWKRQVANVYAYFDFILYILWLYVRRRNILTLRRGTGVGGRDEEMVPFNLLNYPILFFLYIILLYFILQNYFCPREI